MSLEKPNSFELKPTGVLVLHAVSTVGEDDKRKTEIVRPLTAMDLREAYCLMRQAGIETFGGYYHGLLHPFDCYDLLNSAAPFDVQEGDGFLIIGGSFRLRETASVHNVHLSGKSSDFW